MDFPAEWELEGGTPFEVNKPLILKDILFQETKIFIEFSDRTVEIFTSDKERFEGERVASHNANVEYIALACSSQNVDTGFIISGKYYKNRRFGQDLAYQLPEGIRLDPLIHSTQERTKSDESVMDALKDDGEVLCILLTNDKRHKIINYKLDKYNEKSFILRLPSLEYFEKILSKKFKHSFFNKNNRDVINLIKEYL